MYKYRSKHGVVKLNSALKDRDTDLSTGTQTHHSSYAITVIEGTCWSPSIWSKKPLHPYVPQKNVMDPWSAPYQNGNDYWCLLWPENIWQQLPSNISNRHCSNTVLHQRTLQGRWYTHRCEVLLLSSNTVFVGGKSVSSMMPHLTY